jgi:RNase P subunit RPR2
MKKRTNIPARVKLTDCVECKLPFVNPIMDESEEVSEHHWRVVLRCGNCLHTREVVITQGAADLFDDDLDEYTTAMMREHKRMIQENLEHEAGILARALELDLITANDFRL